MGRSLFLLVFAFVLLVLFFAWFAQSLSIVERIAVVDRATGNVEAKSPKGEAWRTLKRGNLVRAKELVRTGPGASAELRWAGWMRARLGENTQFVVRKCIVNRSTKKADARMRVETGSIWIRLRRALTPGSKFAGGTPAVVGAVRGTMFSV